MAAGWTASKLRETVSAYHKVHAKPSSDQIFSSGASAHASAFCSI